MNQDPLQLITQVEQLFKEKKYKKIIALLPDDLLNNLKSAALYAWRARAHHGLKEMNLPNIYADKAIDIDPLFAMSHLVKGNVCIDKKDYNRAIEEYDKAIELDKNNPVAFNNRGYALLHKKEYNEAIEDFNKAIELNGENYTAYNNRGDSWRHKKDYDNAIEDYDKAIRINEKFAIAYNNRGKTWHHKKKYDKAILDFNKAIELNEKYSNAYNNRGNAWHQKKQYDNAIEDYNKAINLNKNFAAAYNNRGNAWRFKKEYNKALEDFNNAIKLDGKLAAAYINRGIVFGVQKEFTLSINDFTSAIKFDEKNASAYYNRGISYNAIQQFKIAIEDFKESIRLKNNYQDFFSKVAESIIKELEKKLANKWYSDVSEIINNIKTLLLFKQDCVTHYTSLSAAKAMILGINNNNKIEKSKFRLSEGAFLNDTSEGRELFDYLNFSNIKKADKTLAEPFTEKPFIGSFVTETKHDDLTLWRMYGKENMVEARGCALTIHKDKFLSALKDSINSKTKEYMTMQTQEQFTFYKVAYIKKDEKSDFLVPGDEEAGNKLYIMMKELKEKIEKLLDEQKTAINELLNGIAYLFKSMEYQFENEVRLIVQGTGFDKTIEIDSIPPKVYIQLIDIVPVLTKITFGPKVERADEWAAAFNYHIKKEIIDSNIPIIISHLPFK